MGDERLVVQMSGAPGAGKTTIARELVRRIGLVALDHDIVKSAVLDGGGTFANAGPVSYGVLLALAGDLLEQGFGVIIDSPCYHDELLDAGRKLAAAPGRAYRYIECVTEDIDVLDRRLRARTGLRSQRPSVNQPPPDLAVDQDATGADLFRTWIARMKRPERFLRLDTTRPLAACVDEALAYLASGAAPAVVRSIGDAGEVARMPEPGRDPDPTVHSLSTFEPAVVERAEAEPAAFRVHIGPSTDSRLHFGQVRVRARWS